MALNAAACGTRPILPIRYLLRKKTHITVNLPTTLLWHFLFVSNLSPLSTRLVKLNFILIIIYFTVNSIYNQKIFQPHVLRQFTLVFLFTSEELCQEHFLHSILNQLRL
jgi:hypothetical protein